MGDPLQPEIREDEPVASSAPQKFDLPPSRKKQDALLRDLITQRHQNHLRAVLNTEAGMAVVMRLLDRSGIYARGELNGYQQGRRDLGIELVREIAALGHDAYEMLKIDYRKVAAGWLAEDERRLENSKADPPG